MPENPDARMNTQTPAGRRTRMNRRYTTMVVAALAIIALSCVAFLLPVPYVTMKPGPVFNTLGKFGEQEMLTFGDDVKTYPTGGTLDFTTVSVSKSDTDIALSTAIFAYLDDDNAVVPRSLIYPDDETQKESTHQAALQLMSSKDNSKAAALRAAGYEVTKVPGVAAVDDAGPSADKLKAGDKILAVDGVKTQKADDVVKLVQDHHPGEKTTITVLRDGKKDEITIKAGESKKDTSVARIGIAVGHAYRLPIKVQNNVDDRIGGPSAGTMFALAIYDILTPGKLTGGERIAGTGVISGSGQVGPIGGIRQKMAGAAADDVKIFLVPSKNCKEATSGDTFEMLLVRIKTLEGAIDSLQKLAKDPDSEVPTCR